MRDLDQTVIKFDHDKNFKNEDFYLSKSIKHVFDFLNIWPKWERNFVNVSGEKPITFKEVIDCISKGLNKKIIKTIKNLLRHSQMSPR